MKLRIRENSIRFRLSKSEVSAFAERGIVESCIEFGDGHKLTYVLRILEAAQTLRSHFKDGCIEIMVPKTDADVWTKTDEVGISGSHNSLGILIEKDFACLTIRENEDESDAFPHPKMSEKDC